MALTIEQLYELHSDDRRCAEATDLVYVIGDEPGLSKDTLAEYLARAVPRRTEGLSMGEPLLTAFLGELFDAEFSLLRKGGELA